MSALDPSAERLAQFFRDERPDLGSEGDVEGWSPVDAAIAFLRREPAQKRRKATHVGAPACFLLELACQHLNRAFGEGYGCYLVGSALERPDWRDVDVRLIMDDDGFERLFPDCGGVGAGRWEFDARWLVMTSAISAQLSQFTGLPVDFQFQPQSHANARHKGPRNALGLIFSRQAEEGEDV